jgi:hypothetical protein
MQYSSPLVRNDLIKGSLELQSPLYKLLAGITTRKNKSGVCRPALGKDGLPALAK